MTHALLLRTIAARAVRIGADPVDSDDLWGDAVNTASRMESHGVPGKIQITRETYELIKDEFMCEPRGTVIVKGKGEMETWYLVGIRDGRTESSDGLGSDAVQSSTVILSRAAAMNLSGLARRFFDSLRMTVPTA